MLRLFHEHANFEEYTLFDTEIGILQKLGSSKFAHFLTTPKEIPTLAKSENLQFFTGQTFASHTRFPRRIYFQITRKCNLACDYCFIKADKNLAHVPTEDIVKIANYMGKQGLIEVRLTGGEPTGHPDFFDIVRAFQQNNVYVSIATNGIWSPQVLNKLTTLKNIWLICSIDGGREVHNKYRPGTFDKIIANLTALKQANPALRLRLTTVLTKENRKDIFALGELGKSLQAESITVIPLRPQVRNPEIIHQMPTAWDFKEAIQAMIAAREKLGVRFTTTLETQYKDKIHPDTVFRKNFSCAAGREGTNLDYNAATKEFSVYACAYSPAVDFNIAEVIRQPFVAGNFKIAELPKFAEIWHNDRSWEIYRNLETKCSECRACKHYKNNTCTGACPIQNIDYNTLDVGVDILTQLKASLAKTSEWYCYKNFLEDA